MPKPISTPLFLTLLLILSCFNLGKHLKGANGQKTWCIANPTMINSDLVANLDYACSHVDCSSIQQGSSCFYPNTYFHHASYAMNLYYQRLGRHRQDCNFSNSAVLALTDPSYHSCTYRSGGTTSENRNSSHYYNQTSETWCVAKPATSDERLQENINFACNHVECSAIQDGGTCFSPTTLMNHAAFAMNLYYRSRGRTDSSCDFSATGLIVLKAPSYGNCIF